MANELPELNVREWYAAMERVLRDEVDEEIHPEKWNDVEVPGNKGNSAGGAKTLMEIPDNHPAEGGPVTPDEEKADVIPADGGFTAKPALTPQSGPASEEIPPNGPAVGGPVLPSAPDKAPAEKWGVKVGRPNSAGKPSGSFARLHDVKYDGDAWATKPAKGNDGGAAVTEWAPNTPASSDGTGPDGNMGPKYNKFDKLDRAPKTSFKSDPKPAPSKADEDLDNDRPDNLSLPDGSFFVQNVGDLKAKIDAVKNADQTNPRASTHPWYLDVKRHLMNRAADLGAMHLIPADWNLSMGMRAEREIARDIDTAIRDEYAKKGWALPNGSYPIGNVHDLRNAIDLARSGHGDVEAAKALIRRRAKELGVTLPADFKN